MQWTSHYKLSIVFVQAGLGRELWYYLVFVGYRIDRFGQSKYPTFDESYLTSLALHPRRHTPCF